MCFAYLKEAGIEGAYKGHDAFDQPGHVVIRGINEEDKPRAIEKLKPGGLNVVAEASRGRGK